MKKNVTDSFVVMEIDITEVCITRDQVTELLKYDFMLWDSSRFGKYEKIFSVTSVILITAFFDVPFTMLRAGKEQTVTVRFATVWRKTTEGLKLVQSLNSIPTIGESAKDII